MIDAEFGELICRKLAIVEVQQTFEFGLKRSSVALVRCYGYYRRSTNVLEIFLASLAVGLHLAAPPSSHLTQQWKVIWFNPLSSLKATPTVNARCGCADLPMYCFFGEICDQDIEQILHEGILNGQQAGRVGQHT